jgi:hypothetical protein
LLRLLDSMDILTSPLYTVSLMLVR